MDKDITVDDILIESIDDMVYIDDEIYHDTEFSIVDDYIDDMVLECYTEYMNNIFDNDIGDKYDVPFNYIIDKTLDMICKYDEMDNWYVPVIGDGSTVNSDDPDYCDDVDICNITPEDFQLSVKLPDPEEYKHVDYGTNSYDSIFNA